MTMRYGGIGELHHALANDCKGLLPETILGPLDAAYVKSPNSNPDMIGSAAPCARP